MTPPPVDHHRRARLLHRVWLEDRVLGVKISPVESGSPFRPQRQDEADTDDRNSKKEAAHHFLRTP